MSQISRSFAKNPVILKPKVEFVTVLLLQESVIAVQKETIDVLSDKIEALQSKELDHG